MRIPFPPVGGLTRMPAPFASLGVCLICLLLMSMSMPVLFLIARSISLICLGVKGKVPLRVRTCLICVLLMSMSTPVLFLIARSIFLICLAVKCKVSLPPVIASFLNLSVTASPRPKARARLTFCPSESEILCG